MANEIDELMSMDPMEMSEGHIDAIIAYHRNNRAQIAAGGKPKKETGPKKEIGSVLQNILARSGVVTEKSTLSGPKLERRKL